MTEARRKRLRELLEQRANAAAVEGAAQQLTALGVPVAPRDAVRSEAVEAVLQAAGERDRFHLVWHRVWGVALRQEVLWTSARLAEILPDDQAVLIWTSDAQPGTPVGFVVPVASALIELPRHLGPASGGARPDGVGSDVLLVTEDGTSGVRLEYNHTTDADEYEMRSWGRFARPVTPEQS